MDSESEDEEETKPRTKRKPLLSEQLCSLNRRGSASSESCSYIRGKVSNKDVFALILVDTGNTTQNDIISEEFFKLTGLPLIEQSEEMTLGTADRTGGGLQVIGRVAELKLHLEGMKTPVYLQPWVVRGLSHPVNIGMKFMQENGAILQTNRSSNRFSIRGESTRTVGLTTGGMFPDQTMDKMFPKDSGQFYEFKRLIWVRRGRTGKRGTILTRKREGSIGQIYRGQQNKLYVREPVTIPGGSMKFISTQATERLEGDVLVEDLGDREDRELGEGLLVPRAVYSAINNIYFVAVSNFGPDPVKLRPGTRVATVSRSEDFNICVAAARKPGKRNHRTLQTVRLPPNPANQREAE